ncbi:MAG TPA: hypothetical protein VJT33_04655 [bacterium]|nr:hypothetical protein [bacterium]
MVAPRALIATSLENLDSAWLTFVMATGILGLAAQTVGVSYGVRLSAAITAPAYGTWLAGAVDVLQWFSGRVLHGRRTRATP